MGEKQSKQASAPIEDDEDCVNLNPQPVVGAIDVNKTAIVTISSGNSNSSSSVHSTAPILHPDVERLHSLDDFLPISPRRPPSDKRRKSEADYAPVTRLDPELIAVFLATLTHHRKALNQPALMQHHANFSNMAKLADRYAVLLC